MDIDRSDVSPAHFFVRDLSGARARLEPRDARHALRSLRLRPGDRVTLADGTGGWADGVLTRSDAAEVDVLGLRRVDRPRPPVSVALAAPAGDRLMWAVQKVAELGVDETILLDSERGVRRWEADRLSRVVQRLSAVAREAAMQSRQAFVMRTGSLMSLDEALATPSVRVLLHPGNPAVGSSVAADAESVRLFIGPEGGFTEEEVRTAEEAGAAVASLGPTILRTETAAVVATALVLSRVHRLG